MSLMLYAMGIMGLGIDNEPHALSMLFQVTRLPFEVLFHSSFCISSLCFILVYVPLKHTVYRSMVFLLVLLA